MTQDEDTPIDGLSELEQDVSPQFLRAIRRKIYRRTAANQMVSFTWNLPRVILIEMIGLIGHFFSGNSKDKVKP